MSPAPPFSPDDFAQRVTELRADVAATEVRLAKLKNELAWHEEGLRLYGDAAPDPAVEPALPGFGSEHRPLSTNGHKPTLREAILTVMREHPTKTWRIESVISELDKRGWLPTGAHGEHRTRSVLSQMHKSGQAKRIGRGRYRLPAEPKEDP